MLQGEVKMRENLKVTAKREKNYVVVYTDGYINHFGGEKVEEECRRLIKEGFRHLVLNLEKSKVVNSIGISILLDVMEQAQEVNGTVSFCGLTPTLAKTFRIMRLTDWSQIYPTELEAIEAVPD
jgi:anti-anti-sigma factor